MLQAGSGYVPSIQPNSHRTTSQQPQVPSLTPQSSQAFNPPRGQSGYTFGPGVLGQQHQPSAVLQQQQQQQQPPSQQQQQQQSQANGTQSSMSSLIGQTSALGATPAMSSAEVSLDPNDFPALGTAPSNPSNNGSGQANTTSYASQAGTGVLLGGTGGSGSVVGGSLTGSQTRDFTPDDFPALGGQPSVSQQTRESLHNQLSGQESLSHPPGLNGFPPSEQQRQNTIGAHSTSLLQNTPGMLNLGTTQTRNIHPGFQQGPSEAEKLQQRVCHFFRIIMDVDFPMDESSSTLCPFLKDLCFLCEERRLIVSVHRITIL